jgi:hypothetical protein
LGNAYLHAGQFEQAIARLGWVIAKESQNHAARWDYAHLQLANRDFAHGWDNYEYRWHALQGGYATAYLPPWRGESLENKTLLVLHEQGLGDQIMFASCYADVERLAKRCIFVCETRLERLFRRSFPNSLVFAADRGNQIKLGEVDFEVQAGTLPMYFRREEAAFPVHGGYLHPDPARVDYWRARLARLGSGLKIGISWRGGTPRTRTRLRTIPLQMLEPILSHPGCHFVSLQYGECEHEILAARETMALSLNHFPEAIADYDETAALVSALDLVITVCTSIVHLTGAVGQRLWILVPSVPEWRYSFNGDTLVWYPAARLFRQGRDEDWRKVVDRVAVQIAEFSSQRAELGEQGMIAFGRAA